MYIYTYTHTHTHMYIYADHQEWFGATIKEVKHGGLYFVSWDDAYSADRSKV